MGVVATIVFWKMKNEFLYPKPTLDSEKIENKSVAEQRRYWKNCIYYNAAIGLVGSLILWLAGNFFEQGRYAILSNIAYLAMLFMYYLCLAVFKLLKLRSQ